MIAKIHRDKLIKLGLDAIAADKIIHAIDVLSSTHQDKTKLWGKISHTVLNSSIPFSVHRYVFTTLFSDGLQQFSSPAWIPTEDIIANANIIAWMNELNFESVHEFHDWTTKNYEVFWQRIIEKLSIQFKQKPDAICDLSNGFESPNWLPNASMNIIDSCFQSDLNNIAIYQHETNHTINTYTFRELNALSNRVANSLVQHHFKPADAIAIIMPMTANAIAIYLGIIKMGGVVVSIADSFSSCEIATRLNIAKTKAIFTQNTMRWNEKTLPLYQKIIDANAPMTIVISQNEIEKISLRSMDVSWENFLVDDDVFSTYAKKPMDACNILFSSGTTGEPKAIIWNHTTPIKVGSDAYFHQNIQANDILCWPTNLGWMMGPWLVFAAFLNRSAVALYPDVAKSRAFGKFIEATRVTMLGVVPTLVAAWRNSHCMENLNWSAIKVFSSTGECSNAEDMFYLMSLANYKPVIEYCGGTEIGGAYISSTVVQPNYPALFSTEVMGMKVVILNEAGKESNLGEVSICPPSIGLSTELLNADHHHVYFEDMPTEYSVPLRRHGDQIKRFPNGYYAILGRVDDAMNLGGIKVSAVEIERVLSDLPHVLEVAAISVPHLGLSQLIIYATTTQSHLDAAQLKQFMQEKINRQLNPLFKIHDVVFVSELPKTASNKILRRVLRTTYLNKKMK